MTEVTVTINVPVEVSRDALALWVAGMLNVSGAAKIPQADPAELDLLDEYGGPVDVTWEAADV